MHSTVLVVFRYGHHLTSAASGWTFEQLSRGIARDVSSHLRSHREDEPMLMVVAIGASIHQYQGESEITEILGQIRPVDSSLALSQIKFQAYAVVNGKTEKKASVHYRKTTLQTGEQCITLTDKEYGHALQAVFDGVAGLTYSNDTDGMSDYFDKGRVRIMADHPLYPAALKRCEENDVKAKARYEAKVARWKAKREGRAA